MQQEFYVQLLSGGKSGPFKLRLGSEYHVQETWLKKEEYQQMIGDNLAAGWYGYADLRKDERFKGVESVETFLKNHRANKPKVEKGNAGPRGGGKGG